MAGLPHWAQKPHVRNKTVVATHRGWMVKETGEYLKLVSALDERLKELESDAQHAALSIDDGEAEQADVSAEKPAENEDETGSETEQPVEEEKPKRKSYYKSKAQREAEAKAKEEKAAE